MEGRREGGREDENENCGKGCGAFRIDFLFCLVHQKPHFPFPPSLSFFPSLPYLEDESDAICQPLLILDF